VVGLAGATAVAVWFLLYDLVAGMPFRTPALLGATIFDGLRDPAALVITSALLLKYTMLHGLAFLAFGIAAAGLFALVDYERRVLFAVFMLFCCFEVFLVGMVMALAEWLIEEIPIWAILGANLLAAVVMLGFLFRSHHRVPREVLTAGE
jgi:cytochrome bd-type quinol oxidase subunit 2